MVVRIPAAQMETAATSFRSIAALLYEQQRMLRLVHASIDAQARAMANIDGLAWQVDVSSYALANQAEANLAGALDRTIREFEILDQKRAAELQKLQDKLAELQRAAMSTPAGAMIELMGKSWHEVLEVGLDLFEFITPDKREVKKRSKLEMFSDAVQVVRLVSPLTASPTQRIDFAKGFGKAAWSEAKGIGKTAKWGYDSGYYNDVIIGGSHIIPGMSSLRPIAEWDADRRADEIRAQRKVNAEVVQYILDEPKEAAKIVGEAMVQDIVAATERGDYEEAAGMVSWEVVSVVVGTKGLTKLTKLQKAAAVARKLDNADLPRGGMGAFDAALDDALDASRRAKEVEIAQQRLDAADLPRGGQGGLDAGRAGGIDEFNHAYDVEKAREMADPDSDEGWLSPAGLRYQGRDGAGKSRVDHIIDGHVDPINAPNKSKFNVSRTQTLALIDEAWVRKGVQSPQLVIEHGNKKINYPNLHYVVDMGRPIGTKGETNILLVTKWDKVEGEPTARIVTAYPITENEWIFKRPTFAIGDTFRPVWRPPDPPKVKPKPEVEE